MTTCKTRLALIGANGMLAHMLKLHAPDNFEITCFDLPEFDLTNRDMVLSTLEALQPSVIVNCAAYTNVDGCESNEELALKVNGYGPGYLAEAAIQSGAVLVHISTDYVFAGDSTKPYSENDQTGPISSYGRSKLAGEQAIVSSGLKNYYIFRTSWLYGPGGNNFVETILRLAGERDELGIVADQVGTPTFTEDLVHAIFSLLAVEANGDAFGIYHISNNGSCSWYDFAEEIIKVARINSLPIKTKVIKPINTEDYPLPAPRPSYSIFSKQKFEFTTGQTLPDWQMSLKKYFTLRHTIS